jgi:hypothetical protein
MERFLYNVHARVSTLVLRKTSSRVRSLVEQVILVLTLCGFALLFISHIAFVYRGTSPRLLANASVATQCLAKFLPLSVNLTHVVLAPAGHLATSVFTLGPDECISEGILFSYSETKGFLLLGQGVARQHDVSTQYISISPTDPACFGEPFLQSISPTLLGKDTIMLNWFLPLETGYVYNPRNNQIVHLDTTKTLHHLTLFELSYTLQQIWVKVGVVITSIFLFFITTTLVSFTLRTTQERMLEFTLQLQAHVRQERPLGLLITTHVLENLVFVPIMLGMMFFLIEFYGGDSLLAFLVMSVVWVAEVFSVVTLRSREGMRFFPRVFFLLFIVFHIYHFSCPFGFTYTSLGVTVSFMVHSMWFFWNRYELPAVAHGLVSVERPRMRGMQGSPTRSVRSIPPLDQTEGAGQILLTPRNLGRDFPSMSSLGRTGPLSRAVSSAGLFHEGVGDDEGSYTYFMNGEVVVHRARSGSPELSDADGPSLRRNTSSSASLTRNDAVTGSPPEVARVRLMEDLTPRTGSGGARFREAELVHTAPAFPFPTQYHPSTTDPDSRIE